MKEMRQCNKEIETDHKGSKQLTGQKHKKKKFTPETAYIRNFGVW